MAKTNAVISLIAAATSNSAGGTTRGTVDLRAVDGGHINIKLTNGGTGPTVQAVARVLVANNTGSTPTAGSAGTDWKTVYTFGGGTTASAVTEQQFTFGPDVQHAEVEVTGNTGQAVVCEALGSTYVY